MSIKGLDVSEFQGTVDWERVKAAGYRFAMLRAGYGFNTVDKQFEQASVAYAAGEGVTINAPLAKQIVTSFCNRVEEKGYYAMFYTNRNFLDTYLGSSLPERYAFWYARYADSFDGTDCGIWQYTSQGSIPGISGDVDLDIGYVDYPAAIKAAGLNHLNGNSPAPSPSPSPAPSPDYITYVIQPGDTLSGIAQRYGTTVSALSSLNGISDPDLIYAGNTIRVPENGGSGSSGAQYYTIQPGDTLSGIAARFGTTVSALSALNGISDPDLIYAGNTIRVR